MRFDGNNYSKEWLKEAEKRGLPHAHNTMESLRTWEQPAVRELFTKSGVLSKEELDARMHIRHEQYIKTINIEAQVLREMAETQILPAVWNDVRRRGEALSQLKEVGAGQALGEPLKAQADLLSEAYKRLQALKTAVAQAEAVEGLHAQTEAFGGAVVAAQAALREILDALEDQCDARLWPLPKYREMLAPLS